MDRTVITSPRAGSSMTTGRLTTVPVPRMATCGWLMIGVSNSAPRLPVLVSVKVPPASSSGLTCPALVRPARSAIFRARPPMLRSPALRMTGTISPRSVSTAMPRCSASW